MGCGLSDKELDTLGPDEQRGIEWIDAWLTGFDSQDLIQLCIETRDAAIHEVNQNNNCAESTVSFALSIEPIPGSAGRPDITFVSANYTDFSKFHEDVKKSEDFLLKLDPFSSYASRINFHVVDNKKDLHCRTEHNNLRTYDALVCDAWLTREAIVKANVSFDKAVVLVKGLAGGSGGGNFGYVGIVSDYYFDSTVAHEIGHMFGLHDEYVLEIPPGPVSDMCFGNCCASALCSDWNGAEDAQCIKGCGFSNWYRSSQESIMSGGITSFNIVSQKILRENLDKYFVSSPLQVVITSPKDGSIISYGEKQILRSEVSSSNQVYRQEVYIDGKIVSSLSSEATIIDTDLNTAMLEPGSTHTIVVKFYDVAGNIGVSDTLNIKISNPVLPDLHPTGFSIQYPKPRSDGNPLPGDLLSISCVVDNLNQYEAANFETRLRIDEQADDSWDVSLVHVINAKLFGRWEEELWWQNVWQAKSGNHNLECCVDNGNKVNETNENNNCETWPINIP